ncbi:hypothetical protein ACJIZ3_020869 [Penstemon smallii]|uniref:Myb-like domain-containing protein n=1 Tax=Penstemon smallii TaxID=265156 RepID=A0ABD3SJT7_9LAMI
MEKRIKQKKRCKEGGKIKDGNIVTHEIENIGRDNGIDNVHRFETDDIIEKKRRTKHCKEKKKNKGAEVDVEKKGKTKRKLIGVNGEDVVGNAIDNAEKKKKREKRMGTNQDCGTVKSGIGGAADVEANEGKKMQEEKSVSEMSRDSEGNKDKKRRNVTSNHIEEDCTNKGKNKRKKVVKAGMNDFMPNKTNKKVGYSGEVKVFTIPHYSNAKKWDDKGENLVRGKRFTREEDEIVKEAVFKYIADYDLGEEGLEMVLDSMKHPKVRGCWTDISTAIPWRPRRSVYLRAQILFRRSENRKWTQEEYDMVLKYQEEYGNKWRALADELGRHQLEVRYTWLYRKMKNLNKGRWSQKEYQQLFDLVNKDLQLKVYKEKKSKHGMLRDNISWTEISNKLSTRGQASCCLKWYGQLTSPMVAKGVWADSDDYRMVGMLYRLDANCMEDVDWDSLLDERSGDLCRNRWNQMVLHIGNHGSKSFAEQVEVLAQRYCPDLLEAREAWDSKPRVP